MGMVKDFIGSLFGGAKEQEQPQFAVPEYKPPPAVRANVTQQEEALEAALKKKRARKMEFSTNLTGSSLGGLANRSGASRRQRGLV